MLQENTITLSENTRLQALQAEIEALTSAAREQERLVIEGYKQMDSMLQEVEAQRNALQGANSEIERAQAYLDRVVDTMDEVLIVIGMHGTIELVNSRLIDLTGYSRDELMGADPSILFSAAELSGLAGERPEAGEPLRGLLLLRLLSRLRDDQLDGHLMTKSGSELAHLFRWSNLYSSKGKKEGVVVVGADVRKLHFTLDALERAHREMRLVLNNVNQGLLTIHMDGTLGEGRSSRVEAWFGPLRVESRIWEYLGQHDVRFGEDFRDGWEAVVDDILPLELNIDQLPRTLRTRAATYDVESSPVFDNGKCSGAFIVITDITAQIKHAEEQQLKTEFLDVLDHINRDRPGVMEFYREAGELVNKVISASRSRAAADQAETMRMLHTIKGNASLFDVKSVEGVCHTLEDQLRDSNTGLSAAQREDLSRVWERFAKQIEKVLGSRTDGMSVEKEDYARLLQMIIADASRDVLLREAHRLTLEDTSRRLSRFGTQAQALAARIGKGDIAVRIDASDERFPAEQWAPFWAAFSHAIRNAVDHGLESEEEREAAGKQSKACLTLRSFKERDKIVLEVADNGRGIDWNKVRARAAQLGLQAESEKELEQLLLRDGFSTRESVSLLSGRGVGMGALTRACQELGGTIGFRTELGQGTTLRCELPYGLVV